jgi:large subunit ribosomal protein L35
MHKPRTKLKTHKGASKRFKVTGTGKIRRAKAFKSHILTKKSTKRKRHLRRGGLVSDGDLEPVRRMLRQ